MAGSLPEKVIENRRTSSLGGPLSYGTLVDQYEPDRHFVEAIEQIIAAEQQNYWEKRGKPVLTDQVSTPP